MRKWCETLTSEFEALSSKTNLYKYGDNKMVKKTSKSNQPQMPKAIYAEALVRSITYSKGEIECQLMFH